MLAAHVALPRRSSASLRRLRRSHGGGYWREPRINKRAVTPRRRRFIDSSLAYLDTPDCGTRVWASVQRSQLTRHVRVCPSGPTLPLLLKPGPHSARRFYRRAAVTPRRARVRPRRAVTTGGPTGRSAATRRARSPVRPSLPKIRRGCRLAPQAAFPSQPHSVAGLAYA